MPKSAIAPDAFEPDDAKGGAILDAAQKIFLSRGFDAASMDVIAAEANVSKRTVYNRFQSKEALFAGVVSRTCQQVLPLDMSETGFGTPPDIFLHDFGVRMLSLLLDEDAIALHKLVTFIASDAPDIAEAFIANGSDKVIGVLIHYFDRQCDMGSLVIEDKQEAAWYLCSLMKEPLHMYAVLGRTDLVTEDAILRHVQRSVSAFLKIYAPK
ncbi:MAG: TetR/AcrR family transcriptional regulator [Pseudomonadota bacterium]